LTYNVEYDKESIMDDDDVVVHPLSPSPYIPTPSPHFAFKSSDLGKTFLICILGIFSGNLVF
jgi:hypothetical protein